MASITNYRQFRQTHIPQPIQSLEGLIKLTNQSSTQENIDHVNSMASYRYYPSLPFIPTNRFSDAPSRMQPSSSFTFDPSAIRSYSMFKLN